MKPLRGIKVVDFSRVLAGPMATQVMSELGADVLKVERPPHGDESRAMAPLLDDGQSAYYFAVNRGKRSIMLDLKDERGRALALDLAAGADVIVENFLPGTMDRMGLGYAEVAARNPGVVYVSNTGFGHTGPSARRKGYDTIFQALSGLMTLTGQPDNPPTKVGVPVADMSSALWIVIAALTGLLGRAGTGHGGWFDVAMMDVQVSQLAIPAARLFAYDEDPPRTGSEHPGRVPSAAFQCADGKWLHISCSDQHWAALCGVLGATGLAGDPALATNAGRLAQRGQVMAELTAAFAGVDRDTVDRQLRAAGVPSGAVNTMREVLNDPQTQARGMVGHFERPGGGSFPALRTPLRMEGFDDPEVIAPPALGADTDDVLTQRLGLDAATIAELRHAGVIG